MTVGDHDEMETPLDSEQETDRQKADKTQERDGDGQDYVDRSKIDFDPDDGHYSGTAVDGTSDIPGPHEQDESGDEKPGSEQDEQPGQDEEQKQ